MMADEKIKNSSELEFVVFCIENVAAKLGMDAERVYQAFAEKSDILSGYIVPEYEVLHTQSREYIVDDLIDVMKRKGRGSMILYHGSFGKDATDYDLVVGGVANDKVFNTVELFFDGLIDKAEAIKRLRYEKPNVQICFRTERALSLLHFEGSEIV